MVLIGNILVSCHQDITVSTDPEDVVVAKRVQLGQVAFNGHYLNPLFVSLGVRLLLVLLKPATHIPAFSYQQTNIW